MALGSDVRDILDLETPDKDPVTKESLMNDSRKKKVKKPEGNVRKPEGMHRELWGLLWTDNKRDGPPLVPSDNKQGYKQMKAKIGSSKVRPWKWMPFTNPARKDGAIFYHYRRIADEGKDYPFSRFNKTVDVPTYSDLEYQQHLHDDSWTRIETDTLFDLCKRFDLRFIVIHDRWDKEKYKERSVEDLKERYYNICNILKKVRAPVGTEPKIKVFDAEHERRRKSQLTKLFERTPEQVEEEENLIAELKKIELRKKEREKKTQDLQKLITAADSNIDSRRADKRIAKKKFPPIKTKEGMMIKSNPESCGIKFPDFKQSGVSLRSQRMKLPASIGQKKMKAIEQVLGELGIEFNPIPTDDVVQNFNELRQDIVLLYELKIALANCEYEQETLRHRLDTLNGIKTEPLDLPSAPPTPSALDTSLLNISTGSLTPQLHVTELHDESPRIKTEAVDVVGTDSSITPNRKRKAALEQSNLMRKIKQKA